MVRYLNKFNLYIKGYWVIYVWRVRVFGYDICCRVEGIYRLKYFEGGESRKCGIIGEVSRVIETGRRIVFSKRNFNNSSRYLLYRIGERYSFNGGFCWLILKLSL